MEIVNKQKGKIIVTSGPTYEEIDDVKVVTNKSSGKQGRALATELSARGYEIIYIHSASIDHIPGLNNVSFHSSNELKNKILENISNTEAIFMTAAVSDFTVKKSSGKISRSNDVLNIASVLLIFSKILYFKSLELWNDTLSNPGILSIEAECI